MIEFWNAMKVAGMASANQFGQNRWGTITSVKQSDTGYEAKILLQPEEVSSGWLPVLSPMVGAGWGLVSPPQPGMQAFVASDTGDGLHGVILGLSYSRLAAPPVPPNDFNQPKGTPVKAGEIALVNASGAVLRMCADGSFHLKGNVRIDGSLMVQGDVSVQPSSASGAQGTVTANSDIASTKGNVADTHGSLDRLRGHYDIHVHGNSPTPTPSDPE